MREEQYCHSEANYEGRKKKKEKDARAVACRMAMETSPRTLTQLRRSPSPPLMVVVGFCRHHPYPSSLLLEGIRHECCLQIEKSKAMQVPSL